MYVIHDIMHINRRYCTPYLKHNEALLLEGKVDDHKSRTIHVDLVRVLHSVATQVVDSDVVHRLPGNGLDKFFDAGEP
jgi:hypothetical protein